MHCAVAVDRLIAATPGVGAQTTQGRGAPRWVLPSAHEGGAQLFDDEHRRYVAVHPMVAFAPVTVGTANERGRAGLAARASGDQQSLSAVERVLHVEVIGAHAARRHRYDVRSAELPVGRALAA